MSKPKQIELTAKFTKLLELHSEGTTILSGCTKLGINRASFYKRVDIDEDFAKAYSEANKLHKTWVRDYCFEKILLGDQQWTSRAWILERMFKSEFSKEAQQVDGQETLVDVLNEIKKMQDEC